MKGVHKAVVAATVLIAIGGMGFIGARPIHAQTQAEMNHSAYRDYQKADAALNAAYKKLAGVLNAEEKTQLKTAQLAWLKFRDAEATFLSAREQGGTIYPTVHSMNMTDLTQKRTQELKDAYSLYTKQ